MRAATVWAAYRKARAIASTHLWDRKARRNELACQKRLEKIVAEHDALRQHLDLYGQHTAGCSGKWAEYRCKCGWREIAAELRVDEGIGGK